MQDGRLRGQRRDQAVGGRHYCGEAEMLALNLPRLGILVVDIDPAKLRLEENRLNTQTMQLKV